MQITYKKISTGIRPLKLAIFFNKDSTNWKSIIEGIIEIYSTLWGGLRNIIIPTDGKSIDDYFLRILTEFDPDLCYYYQYTNVDALYSSNGHEEKESAIKTVMTEYEFTRQQAEKWIIGNVRSDEADIFKDNVDFVKYLNLHLSLFGKGEAKRLFKLHRRRRHAAGMFEVQSYLDEIIPLFNSNPYYFILNECSENLRLLIANYTGFGEHLYSSRIDIHTEMINKSTEIPLINDLYQGRIARVHPFALSGFSLIPEYKKHTQHSFSVLMVGTGPDDFSLYYGLSKIMDSIFWIPSIADFRDSYPSLGFITMEKIADENAETSRTALKISSCSLSEDDLKQVVQEIRGLGISECEEGSMEVTIVKPLDIGIRSEFELYEHGNIRNTYIQQFDNGISTNYIDSPYPKNFKALAPHRANWIIDYEIEGSDLDNTPSGHILPNESILTAMLFDNDRNNKLTQETVRKHGDKYSVRCPTVALRHTYMTPQDVTPRPILRLQQNIEIFSVLFEKAGYVIEPSDKGKYLQYSIDLFSGIDELAKILQDQSIWNILCCYKNETSGKEREHQNVKGVKLKTGAYISYDDFRSFFSEADVARYHMNNLIKRHVFTRGFIFKCEQCANAAWYNINNVTDRFTCSRCDLSQIYLPQHWRKGNEPVFYYRLNEMFFQGFNHDMKEPLLGLSYLKSLARKSFFYLPEFVVKKAIGTGDKQEIDIACIVDGELWIGEAKSGGLHKNDISKYVDLCNKMKAKFILISKEPIPTDIENYAVSLKWEKSPLIKILN